MRKKLIYGIIITVLLLSVSLAACAAPAPAPAEKVNWRHQCAYDTADKEYIALTNFYDAVLLATDGNFVVETFPGETIVPTEELLSATAEGVVEVCHAAGGYWKGVVPVANIEQGLPIHRRVHLKQHTSYRGGSLAPVGIFHKIFVFIKL